MSTQITVVFDLGSVLTDGDPRDAYHRVGGAEAEIEPCLDRIATSDWNRLFDAGRSFAEGTTSRTHRQAWT